MRAQNIFAFILLFVLTSVVPQHSIRSKNLVMCWDIINVQELWPYRETTTYLVLVVLQIF